MYSIGEVSKMFNLPIPTLRYYDKEGLLINLDRTESGIRIFNEQSIEAIRVIECLKKSGMQIKDIKEFMYWCSQGNKTISKRKTMFYKQRDNILNQINELNKVLAMIEFKCWYYEKAEEDGNEKRVKSLTPDCLPKSIKKYYDIAHD